MKIRTIENLLYHLLIILQHIIDKSDLKYLRHAKVFIYYSESKKKINECFLSVIVITITSL